MSKNVVEVDPKKFPWLDLQRYTFTMGVENSGILYISGQTASAYDPQEGRVQCKGDLAEQTKLVFEKLGVVLEAAGMGFRNVVKTVDYLDATALPHYEQAAEVRRAYLGTAPVAATGVCVQRLLRPDALIEISAVAMKEEKRAVTPGEDGSVSAVEAGDILWLSGLMGSEEGHYPQDTVRQVDLCHQSIRRTLDAAGATPGDVVHSVDYIAPWAILQYQSTEEVRRAFYGGHYPAASGVIVNRLLSPEGHVELETVAVKGDSRQEIRVAEWDRSYESLTYRPGIKKGRLLYLSGQGGIDHTTGRSVGEGDVLAQADKAYENIARVLAAGGYLMDDVVNTIEWVTPYGLTGYRRIQEVRRKYFGDRFPTATGVQVYDLLNPELLIQVTAVAVV